MRLLLTAFAAALAGCGGPVPVSVLTTWDLERPTDDPSPEARLLLDAAFDAWGLTWAPSNTTDGSLELVLTWFEDGAAGVHGVSVISGDCDKTIIVEPEPLFLAHEIGHAFGIEDHDEDDGMVMSHPRLDWDISDDQFDTVAEDADRFSRCR